MHKKRIKTIIAVNYFMCAVKFNLIFVSWNNK